MNHCGIDLATKSSYMYVMDQAGAKLVSGEIEMDPEIIKKRLAPYLKGGLKVAIEAGNQTAWIYKLLVEMGAEVIVVNPNKVKLIAESRKKTDKIDAKILCELLRIDALPTPVHMPRQEAREVRGLLAARRQLVGSRTKLMNVVRGLLRQDGVLLKPSSLLSKVGWERLLAREFRSSHLKGILQAYAPVAQTLTESIHKLDKELAERERKDERAARLQTMPGVGRIGSMTLLGAVDQVERFSSARKLVGYSGLAPTVRASAERIEYGSITREGRSDLRAVWVQIAHLVARDLSPEAKPLRRWYLKKAKQRGVKTAMVALARRLLVIAYHMLKQGRDYDPALLGRTG